MSERPLSVLFDLRPAFEGYFGISQETRLTFPLLRALPEIEITGLIHHPRLPLARGLSGNHGVGDPLAPDERYRILSRLVTSLGPRSGPLEGWRERTAALADFCSLELRTIFGARVPLYRFDGAEFGDFLWRTLFAHALPSAEFETCRTARYAALRPPWRAMHATSLLPWVRKYARVDTAGHDVFIAQTPWPGAVDEKTQLVVRYHDAVPVFLPHTAQHPRFSQYFHLSALKANAKSALFACSSEQSRRQVVQLFPGLENRSFVVHNCISESYFPEQAATESIAAIVKSRIDPSTEPTLGSPRDREPFYDAHLTGAFRYILMVSTLEPRKNHLGLLAGWEALRMRSGLPIKLVLAGSRGWRNAGLLDAIKRWQARGELFHLSGVSSSELRLLYGAADAVACPSVSEGFDLSGVEALRCGGAVVASDIPVHREILGDAAIYFDPYSSEDTCAALMRALGADSTPIELRRKALLQGARYDRLRIIEQWRRVLDRCRTGRGQF